MTEASQACNTGGWLRASGLLEIARALGLAVHPAKVGLALVGILLTLAYGGLLDWAWTRSGGVPIDTVTRYIEHRETGRIYVEPTGTAGIFQAWREHQRLSVLGLLGSPVVLVTPTSALGEAVEMRAIRAYLPWYTNLAHMARGSWWMLRFHPVYFVLFSLGVLLIWALIGGAICRIAAVQFARDEKITAGDALRFASKRLIGGFALAPLIPVAFIALITVVMALGGAFLRIPVLGDLLGAPFFVLALLGGLIVAILFVGLVIGGSFFWPAVAVEGSDAFDSFSRSLAYPFSRPWKTAWYFLVTGLYTVICWLIVSFLIHWAVLITRGVVSWGTAPFGWWERSEGTTKLELIWPLGGVTGLHTWPVWSQLGLFEKYSALVVGVYVVLAILTMWAFLFSFLFSADTILYFLLRRDVDGNDTADIHFDEPRSGEGPPVRSASAPAAGAATPATTA